MSKFSKKIVASLLALVMSVFAFGQVTTSSLSGRIVDENGEPLVGATVVAVDASKGTTYWAISNADGRYSINGLAPSEGYNLEYSIVGCNKVVINELPIALGEAATQNVVLQSSEQLAESVVVANTSKFTTEKTGASTNISSKQMTRLPMINRSMADVAKTIFPELKPNDIVIGLGAGTITNLGKELITLNGTAKV